MSQKQLSTYVFPPSHVLRLGPVKRDQAINARHFLFPPY